MTHAELEAMAEAFADTLVQDVSNDGAIMGLRDVLHDNARLGFIFGFLAGRDAAINLLNTKKPEYAYREIKALGEEK